MPPWRHCRIDDLERVLIRTPREHGVLDLRFEYGVDRRTNLRYIGSGCLLFQVLDVPLALLDRFAAHIAVRCLDKTVCPARRKAGIIPRDRQSDQTVLWILRNGPNSAFEELVRLPQRGNLPRIDGYPAFAGGIPSVREEDRKQVLLLDIVPRQYLRLQHGYRFRLPAIAAHRDPSE